MSQPSTHPRDNLTHTDSELTMVMPPKMASEPTTTTTTTNSSTTGATDPLSQCEKQQSSLPSSSQELQNLAFKHDSSSPSKIPTDNNNNKPSTLTSIPGFKWVIVGASFLVQFLAMGIPNIFGVFQSYYLNIAYKGESNSFELAWIGSLTVVFLDICGPFTGALVDYIGHRNSSLVGLLIMVIALILASFSNQVWQLYLTQGVMYGTGLSMTYFASLTIPSMYFKNNRGLVTGMAISGGGLGGLCLSPAINKLLVQVGIKKTLLILAAVMVVVLMPISFLFVTPGETGLQKKKRVRAEREARIQAAAVAAAEEAAKLEMMNGSGFSFPHSPSTTTTASVMMNEEEEMIVQRKFVDFSILKEKVFLLLWISGVFIVCGYFTPFYFISSYAIEHGATTSTAALMVGIMNGSSAVGRIVMGFCSDRFGPINSLVLVATTATLCILLIWTFAKSIAIMYLFSVLYGFMCGGYVSLIPSVAATLCELSRLGSVTGILYTGMAIGCAIGSPVSGAILDNSGYLGVVLWSGCIMAVGTGLLFMMKYATNPDMFARI